MRFKIGMASMILAFTLASSAPAITINWTKLAAPIPGDTTQLKIQNAAFIALATVAVADLLSRNFWTVTTLAASYVGFCFKAELHQKASPYLPSKLKKQD